VELNRRRFLRAGAGALGLAAAAPLLPGSGGVAAGARRAGLPAPGSSGIDHVVVVTMENRSFDHLLGWLPGADGRQAGLSYADTAGASHPTYHLTDFQGCGHLDPDHSYQGGRTEYDNGACDGWLRANNDLLAIGYFGQADLPFLGQAAPYWTTCDQYFAATMSETYPNRLYLHSAQTDRISDTTTISQLPTVWDLLAAAGVRGRYYYSDVPFLALWGTKYLPISQPFATFLTDCALGTLPAVSYVDPRFLLEAQGASGDDHPPSDIRAGETFLDQVYRAVTAGPNWARTALVVMFDEWGGFFDHVPPTTAPDADPTFALRGFRVPCVLVSPWAQRNRVFSDLVFDHTSILRMIEWRWGLPSLTPRDAAANNLAEALNLTGPPNLAAPRWPVPTVVSTPCPPTGVTTPDVWAQLRALAIAQGWPL
jgi:phospholipase C